MTTSILQPTARPTKGRTTGRIRPRWTVAGLLLILACVAALTLVDRPARTHETALNAATAAPAAAAPWWTGAPTAAAPWWFEPLDVVRVEQDLVGVGYSLSVDGRLDPVTKSALADHLQIDAAHPLSLAVADALKGTVITGRRDPAAWNSRFGLNRATTSVERPLIAGPDSQLDRYGNVRR